MFATAIAITLLMMMPQRVCENISVGKRVKQRSTFSSYGATRALNIIYSAAGSLTNFNSPAWWEVDLMGYYSIDNITLIAVNNGWTTHMRNAYVEVMDKDIELCPDAQVMWCGNVTDTVALKQEFVFQCVPPFPVRFVRILREGNVRLSLGHVMVQGSYYEPTLNRKVNQVLKTTSAMTAGACGIQCHQLHSCLHFSFGTTAPSDANCMMTNYPVPQYSVASSGWVLHKLDDCQ